MGLKEKIGVYLLTSALALNGCTSSSQIKTLEDKVQNLEQKISRITAANDIRNVDELYQKMIEPTIRVELITSSSLSGGAGTVLYSKRENNDLVYSYILTSEHVVHTTAEEFSVSVYKYSPSQEFVKGYSAEVLAVAGLSDLAILEVISEEELPTGKLIPKERINEIRIFDKVCTVGFPAEDGPIHSSGEITNKTTPNKKSILITGDYWRINAPAKTGNSGGGVYLEGTKELIGVFHSLEAEVIEHENKNGRKSAVRSHTLVYPHLGIVTSPTAIYDFLDEENLQFIYDNNFTREECFERRRR